MTSVRRFVLRLVNFLRPQRAEEELARELSGHLALLEDDLQHRGLRPEEARLEARRLAGGVEQVKDLHRDARSFIWLEDARQDVRCGLRSLARSPGFAGVAVLTLALGIGANTAIFSIVDGALLHPVPFADADRLVSLYGTSWSSERNAISYPNFIDWQRQNHSFDDLAAWRTDTFTLTGAGPAAHLVGAMVSANLFSTLRVRPLIGRTFRLDEDQQGAEPTVLLGETLWANRFGHDPRILGQSVTLDGRPYTVIGVVPSSVRLERAGRSSFANDVFLPIGLYDNPLFLLRGANLTLGLGRLKPGVSVDRAQADMNVVAAALTNAYPEANRGVGIKVIAFEEDVIGDARRVLWMLLGAVGCVLLIACANVASLMLARALNRSREFAVRTALGAGRGRLVRQLLTESLMLAAAGGVLGIAVAAGTTKAALNLVPAALPVTSEISINAHVLLFALAVSVATGLLFGVTPARHLSRSNARELLSAPGRSVTGRFGMQRVLVVGQIALTLVLLVSAGLMIRSLMHLLTGSFGFDAQGIVTARTELPAGQRLEPDAVRAALSELNERLTAVPGVEAASVQVGSFPFAGSTDLGFWRAGAPRPTTPAEERVAQYYAVGPDYLRAMRIPLLRGRWLTHQDDARHPLVVVVDQDLALSTFGGLDVVGQRIGNGFAQTLEIVGVVGHVKHFGLETREAGHANSQMYVPYMQLPDSAAALFANQVTTVLRSSVARQSLFASIRAAVSAFAPAVAIHDERTMDDAIAASQDRRRFSVAVLGLFAVTALLLSTIGIYGVVSYGVSLRTRDIGIRLALGGSRHAILRGILGEGGRLGALGILLGTLASFIVNRLIASLLFGVSAVDPLTFVSMALVMLLVTLAASYVPARRATRIDPLLALRWE